MYVMDTSVLSALFRNYYPSTFESLWKRFDDMTANGLFTSTREALRELEAMGGPVYDWAAAHPDLFVTPDANEGGLVAAIYAVAHFQANVEKQKLYKGGLNADPFLIARAGAMGATVVTMEKFKANAAKIPNICAHFGIKCLDLEGFMVEQKWKF